MKMIQVEDETHEQAKEQAKEKGMTLMGYIKFLVKENKYETKTEERNRMIREL